MALVSEMVTSCGARVRVFDDLYRDASPEEIKRRRGAVYRALIAMIAEQEEQERQEGIEQLAKKEQGRAAATDTASNGGKQAKTPHTHSSSSSAQSQGRTSPASAR